MSKNGKNPVAHSDMLGSGSISGHLAWESIPSVVSATCRYSPECVEGVFCDLLRHGVLRSSLTVGGSPTEEAPQSARRASLPRQRLRSLHRLADRDLPLGTAIVFCG